MKHRDPNFNIYFLLFFLFSSAVFSQTENTIWTRVSGKELVQKKTLRNSEPTRAVIYSLNVDELKRKLQ